MESQRTKKEIQNVIEATITEIRKNIDPDGTKESRDMVIESICLKNNISEDYIRRIAEFGKRKETLIEENTNQQIQL